MIQLKFVFKSTCFLFEQKRNYPTWIFVWIDLFFIQPRGKLSDSIYSTFESYLEVDDDVWSARVCSSGECAIFVPENSLLRRL